MIFLYVLYHGLRNYEKVVLVLHSVLRIRQTAKLTVKIKTT